MLEQKVFETYANRIEHIYSSYAQPYTKALLLQFNDLITEDGEEFTDLVEKEVQNDEKLLKMFSEVERLMDKMTSETNVRKAMQQAARNYLLSFYYLFQ